MKFCPTEIISIKDVENKHIVGLDFPGIVELRLLYFIIESIKSGAENISIVVKDLDSSHNNSLTLMCDALLDKKILSTVSDSFAPLILNVDYNNISTTYYYSYHSGKSGKQTFNKTKVSEKPTKGMTCTSLNSTSLISVNGDLTSTINGGNSC